MSKAIAIEGDLVIFINRSGYKQHPYVVTWVDAYHQCGAEIMNKLQIEEKYGIDVD